MNSLRATTEGQRLTRRATWLTAAMLCLMLAQFCVAQSAVAQGTSQPPAPQVQEQPKKEPSFFESIGNWFERGFARFKGDMKDAKTNMDNIGDKAKDASKNIGDKAAQAGRDAADATKGAVDAMKKLPATRMIKGNERCDVSPNGAPDCRAAASLICTSKGYASGTSIDFVSAEKCPPAVWMQRRKPMPGECAIETFVTSAMCQ
jgi:hypothetical protein